MSLVFQLSYWLLSSLIVLCCIWKFEDVFCTLTWPLSWEVLSQVPSLEPISFQCQSARSVTECRTESRNWCMEPWLHHPNIIQWTDRLALLEHLCCWGGLNEMDEHFETFAFRVRRGTGLAPARFSSEEFSDLNFRRWRTCNGCSQTSLPEKDGHRNMRLFGLL